MDKANILTKIKELFASQEDYKFMDYKTLDGRILRCEDEGINVGSKITEITENGEVALEDGDYTLEDGLVLTVVEGVVDKIMESEESISEEDLKVETEMGYENKEKDEMESPYNKEIDTKLVDGTEIRVLTKGDAISVGDMVLVKVGEGYKEAPEGRHEVEGGLVVYTDAEGNINEIETKETEERDEVGMEQVFSAMETLLNEVKTLKDELSTIKTENESLKSRVDKFAKAPSAEPVNQKITLKKENREERLKFFGNR